MHGLIDQIAAVLFVPCYNSFVGSSCHLQTLKSRYGDAKFRGALIQDEFVQFCSRYSDLLEVAANSGNQVVTAKSALFIWYLSKFKKKLIKRWT